MTKRSSEPQVRVHLWLPVRDVERLDTIFGENIGRSKAVGKIVRKFLDEIESRGAVGASHPKTPDLSL